MPRTAELLLGEWEGLISNLEKLKKFSTIEKLDKPNNKLEKPRLPLCEQTNTLKEKQGKENSEPAQLSGQSKESSKKGDKVDQETPKGEVSEEFSHNDEPNSSSSSQRTVACSICSVAIAATNIEKHEERCASLQKSFTAPPPSKPGNSRPQLPKLVYALLKETELRKKCKEAGLNWKGDKNTLIKRHKRFSLLYNVEREAERPRPNAVLAAQVSS